VETSHGQGYRDDLEPADFAFATIVDQLRAEGRPEYHIGSAGHCRLQDHERIIALIVASLRLAAAAVVAAAVERDEWGS